MVCIYCGGTTAVNNSRQQKRNNTVWRRRQCGLCDAIFTSVEQAELSTVLRIKQSSTKLEPFIRDILFVSIFDSCKHRPTALEDAIGLTATCVAAIIAVAKDGILTRNTIIDEVAAILDRFDKSAATMYRAYHPL